MKTYQEFLAEGKLKKAFKDFKKAHKATIPPSILSKETAPGSPERREQVRALNRYNGGKKIIDYQKARHNLTTHLDKKVDSKPEDKRQKFIDKWSNKIRKVVDRHKP